MCLGAGARAANRQAKRNYEYQLKKREADWMQTLSVTNTERIMHEQLIDSTNLGLADVYGDIQSKFGDEIGQALQEDEQNWKKFLEDNKGAKMAASGQTGRSAARVSTLELAEYFKKGSRKAYELSESKVELDKQGRKAYGQARAQQMQSFANNAMVKSPDIAPPKPVYQNVGAAMFMDALSIGTSAATMYTAFSSKKLKDNIIKIGESIAGHNIYKFNYKGSTRKFIGVIAEEIQQTVPEAVVTMSNGLLGVNYNLIDVTFKEV